MNTKESQDPIFILQTAIQELDKFTQSEASRLEIGEDGHLVAAIDPHLERVIRLARSYIGPLFSYQLRQEQEKKLGKIKHAILKARDLIQSHSALIEKFKEGDDSQRKLADYALTAIQRYNAAVTQDDNKEIIKKNVYNYERRRLLLDQEIQGQQIQLPRTVSIKYESHPNDNPAHKMFKELSRTFAGAVNKSNDICPTHKKTMQFMIDTFHMKAIRMMQSHLTQQNSIGEILPLVKQTPLEIDDFSQTDLITMRQYLEVGPGFFILVSGCFNRNTSNPKFMTMPILDSFRLSFQLEHSGFPYPAQHSGWALADKWIEAFPLRLDQVPSFQQIDQKKKAFNQKLLFDQDFIQKVRRYSKLKRDVFDRNRHEFIPLHRQLQVILKQNISTDPADPILDAFYHEVAEAPSAFDVLVQTQQQMLNLFVREPIKALEEEWLSVGSTPLRTGTPQEKFQTACQKLEQFRFDAQKSLDPSNNRHAYILQQGLLIGRAFQAIGLQYQSEKMGFSPPLLNDFERKLQACAFHQLRIFMDECEHQLENLDLDQIKEHLLALWFNDLNIFLSSSIEEDDSYPISIINELEFYFNSRFYTFSPRISEKAI